MNNSMLFEVIGSLIKPIIPDLFNKFLKQIDAILKPNTSSNISSSMIKSYFSFISNILLNISSVSIR